jgi:ankyrin repeat protein
MMSNPDKSGESADDFDSLVAKFNSSTITPTPAKFADGQRQQNIDAKSARHDARGRVTGLRMSFGSAMATAKPRTIARMASISNAVGVNVFSSTRTKKKRKPSRPFSHRARRRSGNPMFAQDAFEQGQVQPSGVAWWDISQIIYRDDASQLRVLFENCRDCGEMMDLLACDRDGLNGESQVQLAGLTNESQEQHAGVTNKSQVELIGLNYESQVQLAGLSDESQEQLHRLSNESQEQAEVIEIDAVLRDKLQQATSTNRSDPCSYIVLVVAATFDRVRIVEWFLTSDGRDVLGSQATIRFLTALQIACVSGCGGVVKLLLADGNVNPTTETNAPIRLASLKGHVNVVELLLADPRVDPSDRDNSAIQWSSRNGHDSVVKVLLTDARVDPTAGDNYAIRLASERGHQCVVKLLQADSRVDPSADDNYAIRFASRNGHASVAELLLADCRVDPTAGDNFPIRLACLKGYPSVVKLLLADRRVDPGARSNMAMRFSCLHGHTSVVELLLADPRVDPAVRAIQLASQNGHAGVVKLLLADPRVDPSVGDNAAVVLASLNGHASVLELLLADTIVDPSASQPSALENACAGGYIEVARMLLAHQKTVVTTTALGAADARDHGDLIRLLLDAQPQITLQFLFAGGTVCKSGGELRNELRRRERRSALTFLLALERRAKVLRVSDVMHVVVHQYACFDVEQV